MGVVLGVEAAVGVAEAAEAAAGAAEAGEAIGSAAEAGEAIGSAAEAGEAAGAEAGDGAAAAAESGGDALQTLTKAVEKLGKMVVDFERINLIFKAANAILEPLIASDPSARAKVEKLTKLIEVLNESSSLLSNLTDWLNVHAHDTNDLKNFTVTTRAVLSKFIPRLGAVSTFFLYLVGALGGGGGGGQGRRSLYLLEFKIRGLVPLRVLKSKMTSV